MNKIDLTKTQIVDPPIDVEVINSFSRWFNAKLYSIDHRLYYPYRCVLNNRMELNRSGFYKYARHIQTKIKVPDNIHVYLPRRDKCIILFNNDKQRLAVDNEGIYSVHKNTETTKQFAQLIPADKDNLEVGCGYYFVWNGHEFEYINNLGHYGIYDGKEIISMANNLPYYLPIHSETNIEVYKIIPDEGE